LDQSAVRAERGKSPSAEERNSTEIEKIAWRSDHGNEVVGGKTETQRGVRGVTEEREPGDKRPYRPHRG